MQKSVTEAGEGFWLQQLINTAELLSLVIVKIEESWTYGYGPILTH